MESNQNVLEETLKSVYHGCLWAKPEEIHDNPFNPRELDSPKEQVTLKELALSISSSGLWQYPLFTKLIGFDGLYILAGHRRTTALLKNLHWPCIPYHPSEWHGLPSVLDPRDSVYVVVMDQELNKKHSAAQKARVAQEMHKQGVLPVGMPKSWESRRQVWIFADKYPEVKKALSKSDGGYSGTSRRKNGGTFRTSIGWTVVSDLLVRSRGYDDVVLHCMDLYMKNASLVTKDIRYICAEMVAQRLEEERNAVNDRVS